MFGGSCGVYGILPSCLSMTSCCPSKRKSSLGDSRAWALDLRSPPKDPAKRNARVFCIWPCQGAGRTIWGPLHDLSSSKPRAQLRSAIKVV